MVNTIEEIVQLCQTETDSTKIIKFLQRAIGDGSISLDQANAEGQTPLLALLSNTNLISASQDPDRALCKILDTTFFHDNTPNHASAITANRKGQLPLHTAVRLQLPLTVGLLMHCCHGHLAQIEPASGETAIGTAIKVAYNGDKRSANYSNYLRIIEQLSNQNAVNGSDQDYGIFTRNTEGNTAIDLALKTDDPYVIERVDAHPTGEAKRILTQQIAKFRETEKTIRRLKVAIHDALDGNDASELGSNILALKKIIEEAEKQGMTSINAEKELSEILSHAARQRNLAAVELLLPTDASVHTSDALINAIASAEDENDNDLAIIDALTTKTNSINAYNNNATPEPFKGSAQITPLIAATHLRKYRIMQKLIDAGADVNVAAISHDNGDGYYCKKPIYIAFANKDVKAMELLTQKPIDWYAFETHRNDHDVSFPLLSSVLEEACKTKNYEILDFVLKQGANPNSLPQNTSKRTEIRDPALHYAVEQKDAYAVQKLLDAGADANMKNGKGQTAIMLAAKEGMLDIVESLLKANANTLQSDLNGKTLPDYINDCKDAEKRNAISLTIGMSTDGKPPGAIVTKVSCNNEINIAGHYGYGTKQSLRIS